MNSNLFLNIVFTDEYRFSIEINSLTVIRMREKTIVSVRENIDGDFFCLFTEIGMENHFPMRNSSLLFQIDLVECLGHTSLNDGAKIQLSLKIGTFIKRGYS